MKNIYYKSLIMLLAPLLVSVQIFGQADNFTSQITITEQTCPSLSSLKQNSITKTWSAPGGWRSINPSFHRELEQFIGAQWVGVNVGNVICSYAMTGRSEFPVHIQRNTIVPAPIGGMWTEDKGGYRDCISSNITQCGYSVITPAKPRSVYEEIDFFKDKNASDIP